MRVLVTGSTGFVGRRLLDRLVREGRYVVRAASRCNVDGAPRSLERVWGDLTADMDWQAAVGGVDVVVHLAARVHVMRDVATEPLAEFRKVNVAGTLRLAEHAAGAGVRRFVFVSSVKVNGESGRYVETDIAAPEDPYGISKHEAEEGLRRIATATGIEVVIIRPPLVYGPGVRANFAALIGAIARGIPLPLGAINNRRSLVGVDNLVDFILACVEHPAAANEVFMVSDGEDLSTSELVRRLALAMGRPSRVFPVPPWAVMAASTLVGRREVARRLIGSLSVDITKAQQILGWVPPVSVDAGLERAVTSRQ